MTSGTTQFLCENLCYNYLYMLTSCSLVQGVTTEPQEDNLFVWKCSIKADVCHAQLIISYTCLNWLTCYIAIQPLQGWYLPLHFGTAGGLSLQATISMLCNRILVGSWFSTYPRLYLTPRYTIPASTKRVTFVYPYYVMRCVRLCNNLHIVSYTIISQWKPTVTLSTGTF